VDKRSDDFSAKATFFFFGIAIFVMSVFLCTDGVRGAEQSATIAPFIKDFIAHNATQIGRSEQLIFSTNRDASSFLVTIHVLEKNGGIWKRVFPAFNGTIGRKGFASIDKKKEGDGKSPTGIFPLGMVFGHSPSAVTRMPYRQATENDFWVDDANSEDYNKWVKGQPKAASMEKMKRQDDVYKYGIVIEYNMNPIVKGKGSAIFLHIWRGNEEPTLGCVAMPEDKVVRLLGWLDPARKPLIVIGAEAELGKMRSQQ
jgi:L,D-peptidoglycan transpeptidase YkuD (ErfK/YbiS/YcfS/YnhG family)